MKFWEFIASTVRLLRRLRSSLERGDIKRRFIALVEDFAYITSERERLTAYAYVLNV